MPFEHHKGIKEKAKYFWTLIKEAGAKWVDDKAARLGAALAYYTMFSLAPLVIIAIAVAGLFFGEEAARGQIQTEVRGMLGERGAAAVQDLVANASTPSSGIAASVFGIAMLLFGASGVFGQLQDALNTIWGVTPKPGRGIMGFLKDRFISFSMVMGIGFLLMVSLILSTVLSAMGKFLDSVLPLPAFVFETLNFLLSFGVITLLFAMIFKVLPDVKIPWRFVWLGAVITALLFTVGKFLLGFYLGRGSVTSAYGAAASLVVVLIWVYYSAQILFFGAEFTEVYAKHHGVVMEAAENAVPVTKEARSRQGMPSGAENLNVVPNGYTPKRPKLSAADGFHIFTHVALLVTVQKLRDMGWERRKAPRRISLN